MIDRIVENDVACFGMGGGWGIILGWYFLVRLVLRTVIFLLSLWYGIVKCGVCELYVFQFVVQCLRCLGTEMVCL